jgi:hypothetical protein
MAAIVGYFLLSGAFEEFVTGFVLFNLKYVERPPWQSGLFYRLTAPIGSVYRSYAVSAIPILLGALTLCVLYIWRFRRHGGSILQLLAQDRFAGLLLSLPVAVFWILLDFQSCPDLYFVLPYLAIGFGWLLSLAFRGLMASAEIGPVARKVCFVVLCGALVASAAVDHRISAENDRLRRDGLADQRRWAAQVEAECGSDCKLVSIGVPEVLVLLRRTNPNPFVFIIDGTDNWIEASTPGGFDGWLQELEAHDPSAIAFGPTDGRFKPNLVEWLHAHYEETTVGGWTLFVKSGMKEEP